MHRTDLNLLIVLDMLLEVSSVSKTARKLNVTPPAISKSLNKIREAFQDQILVRSGSKLMLTPLAFQLKPQIRKIINDIKSIFYQNLSFRVGEQSLSFNIVSNDILISILSYHFISKIKPGEPNVLMEFKYDNLSESFLRKENLDLYIGESRDLSPEIKIRTVYRDNCLIIANTQHEILKKSKNLDNLSNYNFISTKGQINTIIDQIFLDQGYQRKIISINPSYFSTLETIINTNCLAVIPISFFHIITRLRLEIAAFQPEINLPKISIIQAWHPRNDNSPAHKWLRDYTLNVFKSKLITQ
ncbi:MAG: LysR family transcriptional regulator [Candidatus Dasytiphilus stammeri]